MINDADLMELKSAVLTGVTVGIGSQILIFGNGASVIVQCPFLCDIDGRESWGSGEEPYTSQVLFDLLNLRVVSASFLNDKILALKFEEGALLKVCPERNGLESYVLITCLGICPVIMD